MVNMKRKNPHKIQGKENTISRKDENVGRILNDRRIECEEERVTKYEVTKEREEKRKTRKGEESTSQRTRKGK